MENNYSGQSWMMNYQYKSMLELYLPGSHNSATSVLSKRYRGRENNIPSLFNGFIKSWAKCQNLSLSEQFNLGVRYFDFRVTRIGEVFYLMHDLISMKFADACNELKSRLLENRTEKIIIDINHAYGMEDADFIDLDAEIGAIFGEMLVSPDKKVLSQPIITYNSQVIVSCCRSTLSTFRDIVYSPWPDKNNVEDVKSYLRSKYENLRKREDEFKVVQLILTETKEDIAKGIVLPCGYANSLEEFVEDCDWMDIIGEVDFPCVMLMDFVEGGDERVKAIIQKNTN